ncbi:acyl-CoA synthetase (plasmid) [Streptomyces atratus]|uniref:AMP-binding enzyme n=1 Tax=Streptomyces atratus TaxID=1893 RepID=A0A1K1ZUW1_STRAR|nr:acyl-CoA synthetase [Streptomyces atratus]SFX77237.1 AMP-binding enzyme [Streptomyces atratus]
MAYPELTPQELLREGFTSPRITEEPWVVRWDTFRGDLAAIEGLVLDALPPKVAFQTSGTTGASQTWYRSKEFLWSEAGMLARLLAPRRPDAALSFVHPKHLYGALTSVLVPARLGIPVWYRPQFAGQLPPAGEHQRWAVMAIPWIFSLLRRHMSWVHATDRITVLHASGMIPDASADFLTEAGAERARIVEVFGATESGGVATRQWSEGAPPDWNLIDDVSFADPVEPDEGEVALKIRSPRLAFLNGEDAPDSCELDDHVERLGGHAFRFTGRRTRLVNVNGRRLNLDRLEDVLRPVLDCVDHAVRPVTDPMIGEHIELLVVLKPGTELGDLDLNAAFTRMGLRPREVRTVDRIDRTEIGKFRRVQTIETIDAGATS